MSTLTGYIETSRNSANVWVTDTGILPQSPQDTAAVSAALATTLSAVALSSPTPENQAAATAATTASNLAALAATKPFIIMEVCRQVRLATTAGDEITLTFSVPNVGEVYNDKVSSQVPAYLAENLAVRAGL